MQEDAHLEDEGNFLVAAADVWRSAAAADRPAFSENSSVGHFRSFGYFNIALEPHAQQLQKSSRNLQSAKEKSRSVETLHSGPH